MTDPRFASSSLGADADERQRQRATMAETLQQALRSIGATGGATGSSGLTPEALQELARRAGIPAASQGELARMMGAVGIAEGSTSGALQDLVFALDEAECALPAESVQGVERINELAVVPNTAPWVVGIVHLRGSILSVVDLRAFFGLPTQGVTSRTRLLVASKRDMTIGLVVDGITEMRSLEEFPSALDRAELPDWAAPYAQRSVSVEGRAIVMLDPERLLLSDKMQRYRADSA